MSLVEAVRRIVSGAPQHNERVPLVPTQKLQDVVDRSKILDLFGQLSGVPIEVEREIMQGGEKMVLVAKWGGGANSLSQVIVSVTESSISFIGSTGNNQYIRLEGKKMQDSRKIERSLKETFLNPQILSV